MNIALITGASSGIGHEFVMQIAEKYSSIDEIWVIARRHELLLDLKEKLKNVKIRIIVGDLNKDDSFEYIKDRLKYHKPSIRMLVNCAGNGIIGHFDELTENEVSGLCRLNCEALSRIISICIPYMNKINSYIINIASAAAFFPQPSFAAYSASKSYVLSLSLALREELKKYNIHVTAVCPGPVETSFFDNAQKYHKVKSYKKRFIKQSKEVVSQSLIDARHKKAISICGLSIKAMYWLSRIVPPEIIVKFIK